MRFLRSWEYSKTTVDLIFTAQKTNACRPYTACSVFDWKYPLCANLVQKLNIASLSLNLVIRLIQICRIPQWCSYFLFSTGNTFLGKIGSKNQNCQFELNVWTNFNMQNSGGVHFFCFRPQISLSKLDPKIQNCLLKVNFDTKTKSNMQNSMVVSILYISDWK